MKTQAIVAAGGTGTRLGTSTIKPLVHLAGKPLVVHCLETLAASKLIDSIILVASAGYIQEFEDLVIDYQLKKIAGVVSGGENRTASVYHGLLSLKKDTQFVLVHDGARPLASKALMELAIRTSFNENAVITAIPVKPTIKRINPHNHCVLETLDRNQLWEVQTPQVFKKELLLKAHNQVKNIRATDDAYLVEKLKHPVKVVRGEEFNLKVTTREDLVIAEALLTAKLENDNHKALPVTRSASGE